MSHDWTARVWAHSRQIGSAKLLLLAIAQVADEDGSTSALNIPALVHLVGTKERNIQTLLAKLEAVGELRREFGAGPHGRTRYILLHPPLKTAGSDDVHVESPVQIHAPHLIQGASDLQSTTPHAGAVEHTALRKEGAIDRGKPGAHVQSALESPEAPNGEPALPAAPWALWQAARSTPQPLDEAHLCTLAAEHDGSTDGFGAYWLGRAILAASMSDTTFASNPRALNLVRAILSRWKREGSYGSDTVAYQSRQEQRHDDQAGFSSHPAHARTDAHRRIAHGSLSAAHRRSSPARATICTIVGRHADGER